MNNSNTLGLNEFGMESKMLRDIDMYISLSNDGNCIIMPAIIENYANANNRLVLLETNLTSVLAATLTRKMHISAMGDGNMLERKKLSGFPELKSVTRNRPKNKNDY